MRYGRTDARVREIMLSHNKGELDVHSGNTQAGNCVGIDRCVRARGRTLANHRREKLVSWNNASGSEQSARSGEIRANPERVITCRCKDGRGGAWLWAMLLVSGSWYSATSRSVLHSLWKRSETRLSVKKNVKSLERKQQTSNVRAQCKQSRRGQVTRMYSRLLVYLHGVNPIGRYQLLTRCL